MTIFEKIIQKKIPARIIYEDDDILSFHDVDPKAPVHALIVPKRMIARLSETKENDGLVLGKLLAAAPKIAAVLGVAQTGYRVVINNGPDAGESVPHLHVHLLGGRVLAWPPG